MRTRVLVGVALTLGCALIGCSKRGIKDFQEFTPVEGDYTVLLPRNPKREIGTYNGVQLIRYAVEGSGEGYGVGSCDLPQNVPLSLTGAVEGMARDVSGTFRWEGDDWNGWGFREFEIEGTNPKKMISGRVLIARGRFYLILAFGSDARLSNPTVRAFLESFRLTEGETPGPINRTPKPTRLAPRPLAKDGIASTTSDPTFRDVAPAGGLLVGFDVWYGTYASYDTISGLRPVYSTNGVETTGQNHGSPTDRGTRVRAKPGYAVGGVVVKFGSAVDSLSVTFMKVTGDRLNPRDATTEKVGGPGGFEPTQIGGDGTQVIGISGRKNTNLTGLGLVFASGK